MGDAIFVAVAIAFFAIAVAYVKGCAWMVGDDDDVVRVADGGAPADDLEERAA